jgi:hypothetical protein
LHLIPEWDEGAAAEAGDRVPAEATAVEVVRVKAAVPEAVQDGGD